jgi:hypothetical protein
MSNTTMPHQHGHNGHAGDQPTTQPQHTPAGGHGHDMGGHPGGGGGGGGGGGYAAPSSGGAVGPSQDSSQASGGRAQAGAQHGRDKIDWGPEVWKRIDAAVKEEIARSRVAAKVLPCVHVPAKATTVPADIIGPQITEERIAINALSVDETATTRINEYWVEFSLTPAQVEEEAAASHGGHTQAQGHGNNHPHAHGNGHGHGHHQHMHASTGVTLATRAANILAQVEDSIILQGQNAFLSQLLEGPKTPVNSRVTTNTVNTLDLGLLNLLLPTSTQPQLILPLQPNQIVQVSPVATTGPQSGLYQERTVAAVAQAYSILQANGQYGPYALILHTVPFADAHSPLPTTLITPAEPIRHLMNAGFFGTGTLPPFVDSSGNPGGGLNGGMGTGSLTSIQVVAGGSGYAASTTIPVSIPAPPSPGVQAVATATTSAAGVVTGVTITNPGSGYKSVPSVTVSGGTGAVLVVPQILYTGIMVSLGGNTMDLVRGKMNHDEDVMVRFEQKDVDGNYRFRVVERFALRLKDITAVVQLQFMSN